LVERVKYHERTEYVPILGELMARVFEREFLRVPPDLLVPVPLHRVRMRERGFNQAERLARHLGGLFNTPVAPRGALMRIRATPSQTRLTREDRAENIRGAFEVKAPEIFAGRSVLLVDDVYTTGATLNEVAGALAVCRPDDINCIAFARTLLDD
jgi:ComF family protein